MPVFGFRAQLIAALRLRTDVSGMSGWSVVPPAQDKSLRLNFSGQVQQVHDLRHGHVTPSPRPTRLVLGE